MSTTVHNLLFCIHTLCMNYLTNTFLLVSSSVQRKRLFCFVHCRGQTSEQKHTTKISVSFHNHYPLLTVLRWTKQDSFGLANYKFWYRAGEYRPCPVFGLWSLLQYRPNPYYKCDPYYFTVVPSNIYSITKTSSWLLLCQ